MKLHALDNGWTGGQYSFFRILFGGYLFVHFAHLIPWAPEVFSSIGMLSDGNQSPIFALFPNILRINDNPLLIQFFIGSGAVAALFFMAGAKDKMASIWMWYILACLFSRNPLIANPSLPYVGWMLIAHCFVTAAPYGSWAARKATNFASGWVMPKDVFTVAWIVLALSYSYSGYTKLLSPSWVAGENINYVLNNPLARDYFLRDFFLTVPEIFLKILTWSVLYIELLFAPLVLIKKLRPVLWGVMLFIQFGFAFLLNFIDLTFAMLMFHILTFDPAWVKGKTLIGKPVLFYDGKCGFCHKVIKFLLAEDTKYKVVHYGALQSASFEKIVSKEERNKLPESIVLVLKGGRLLTKTSAVVELLRYLGGGWRLLALLLWIIPKPIRDIGYDSIGAVRNILFKTPNDLCPIVPKDYRDRFVL